MRRMWVVIFCSIQLMLSLSLSLFGANRCVGECCVKIQMKWLCWTEGRKENIVCSEKLSKKKKKKVCC